MNRDLFLAILALDSYNRSYGQRLDELAVPEFDFEGNPTSVVKLGEAEIVRDSSVLTDESGRQDIANDFYAIAYDWNGETVISYRGTDNLGADALSGYAVGAGIGDGVVAPQADLAIEFYESLSGQDAFSANTPDDIVLTGHSLGGGLAGLVSTISGVEAIGFDYMPFAVAGLELALDNLLEEQGDISFLNLRSELSVGIDGGLLGGILDILEEADRQAKNTPEAYEALGLHVPNLDSFRGEFVEGELLTLVRDGTLQALGAGLGVFFGRAGVDWIKFWATSALRTAELEGQIGAREISTHGAEFGFSGLNPALIQRHSQALLVILKYAEIAESEVSEDWQAAAEYILPTLFEDKIAETLGRTVTNDDNPGGDGLYALNDQLKAAIAYSAIDEGERPFGDVAIKSLFDDATDLGRALALSNASRTLTDAASGISEAIVQYAGKLAFGDVETDGVSIFEDGIVTLSENREVLTIDFSDAIWDVGQAHSEILGKRKIVSDAIEAATLTIDPLGGGDDGIEINSSVRAAALWLYNDDNISNVIDRIVIRTTDDELTGFVPERPGDDESGNATLFASGGGNDTLFGSGGGNDNDWTDMREIA